MDDPEERLSFEVELLHDLEVFPYNLGFLLTRYLPLSVLYQSFNLVL
jgi:hypothetical protein